MPRKSSSRTKKPNSNNNLTTKNAWHYANHRDGVSLVSASIGERRRWSEGGNAAKRPLKSRPPEGKFTPEVS
jgi:hypothetical protein